MTQDYYHFWSDRMNGLKCLLGKWSSSDTVDSYIGWLTGTVEDVESKCSGIGPKIPPWDLKIPKKARLGMYGGKSDLHKS